MIFGGRECPGHSANDPHAVEWQSDKRLYQRLSGRFAGGRDGLRSGGIRLRFLQLRLRPPSVAFGPVVVGSWASQDVLLSNIGELPMTFRFVNTELYPGLVSISPPQGTLQPRAHLPVTVTFRPSKVRYRSPFTYGGLAQYTEKGVPPQNISSGIAATGMRTRIVIRAVALKHLQRLSLTA